MHLLIFVLLMLVFTPFFVLAMPGRGGGPARPAPARNESPDRRSHRLAGPGLALEWIWRRGFRLSWKATLNHVGDGRPSLGFF